MTSREIQVRVTVAWDEVERRHTIEVWQMDTGRQSRRMAYLDSPDCGPIPEGLDTVCAIVEGLLRGWSTRLVPRAQDSLW